MGIMEYSLQWGMQDFVQQPYVVHSSDWHMSFLHFLFSFLLWFFISLGLFYRVISFFVSLSLFCRCSFMLFGVFAAVALHFLVLLIFLGLSFTAFFRSFCLFSVVPFVLSLFLSLVLSFVLFFCGYFCSIFVCFIRVISVVL